MAKIEIYTTPFCGYCARAKSLLDSKGDLAALEQAGKLDALLAQPG